MTPPFGRAASIDQADPRGDIRRGLVIAVVFFVGLVGWAAAVRLDAAATAQGTLEVAGQRQSVQHREGGVVDRILVHEGQRVTRGQLLVTLVGADIAAQEQALAGQAARLLIQRARLAAEEAGRRTIVVPPELAELGLGGSPDTIAALRLQQSELDSRAGALSAQRSALRQRSAQAADQGRGYDRQRAAAEEQLRIVDEQLTTLKPVAEKGFVPQTRIRELQRARAELLGQQGQYAAGVAQTRGAARESRLQGLEAMQDFRRDVARDRREVETALGDVLPKLGAARDQLARTQIRSPATGTVVGLTVFTPGGVIAPGQKLMDVVPARAELRVQIRLGPNDAADVVAGQQAFVKFPSLHDRNLPDLTGTVTQISADNLVDERTGQSYFAGEVVVPPTQIVRLREAGRITPLRAGMPAQVLILLRRRTMLQYLMEPLTGVFWGALRER